MTAASVPSTIVVRVATDADWPTILALRERQMREEIGRVPLIPALVWLVAEEGGVVRAAGGGVISQIEGYPRTAIVTELLDDGTLSGKRGLLALIEDALASPLELYVSIPKDREGLKDALERRGLELDGFQMRRRRAQ